MKPPMTTLAVVILSAVMAAPAAATITPDRDAPTVARALADGLPPGAFGGASFVTIPPAPEPPAECANGLDDDFDEQVDAGEDPGCESGETDNREQDDATAQCANGFDDDLDDLIDFPADPDCSSPQDDNEHEGEDPVPACSNGVDDDGDDRVDGQDVGCGSGADLDEGSEGQQDTNPVAVADSALAGFPASGPSYAVLSSGNSLYADNAKGRNASGQDNRGGSGDPSHGDMVDDLVTLRVDLNVPIGASCLRTDFRFFSNEVAGTFNDAFVAELDQSDFTVDGESVVSAPHNFAFDTEGGLISVNTASFSPSEAAGTTYDGATPRLRASTPITPGGHSIYLSVFDVGDEILDSAVFVDAVRLTGDSGDACASGASADVTAPAVGLSSPANGSSSTDATPAYGGAAGDAAGDSGTVTVEVFGGGGTSGSPLQTLSAARSGGSWAVEGPALSPGTYTARARQADGAGNVGFSGPSTFTITSGGTVQEPLPRPVTGKAVNVEPVKGVVTVRLPDGRRLRLEEAEQIPTGSVVDTRQGTVRLFSTAAGGKIQSALFFDGLFRVTQTKGARPVTDLKLVEKLARCPKPGTKARSSARRKKRRLWGDGRGSFRTSGRRSAATVSGTKWLVQDDCKGTLTRVARGKVRVRDFKRKKTVTVRAGRSYRAR
jgi:hypothetical protein